MKKSLFEILCIVILCLSTNCERQETHIISDFINFESSPLSKNCQYNFIFNNESINDSILYVDTYIIIRFSNLCEIQSLPLEFEYSSIVDNKEKKDTISVPLFNSFDKIEGRRGYAVYEAKFPCLQHLPFNRYSFFAFRPLETIEKGILSVGLYIKPENE